MEFIVFQNGDKRQETLAKLFINDNDQNTGNVLILPIQGLDGNGVVYGTNILLKDYIKVNNNIKVIFTGKCNSTLKEISEENKIKCISYLEDFDFSRVNTILTVEGTIANVINETEIGLFGSNVLIFGYGKIGQILAKRLSEFNATVTIITRHEKDILSARLMGYNAYSFSSNDFNYFKNQNIIINTIPIKFIDDKNISKINNSTYFLNVASKPGPIDESYKSQIKFKYNDYLGIPGKIAPKTAAFAIYKTICSLLSLEEGKNVER